MRYLALVIWGLGILAFGAWLRFSDLERQPFHADEAATGAQSLSYRLAESGDGYQFDPTHRHGPMLTLLAEPWSRAQGETSWETFTVSTLREVTAFCGLLVILGVFMLGVAWPRALLAAGFVATSPLLVYYSRLFIHESIFLMFAIPALAGMVLLFRGKRVWLGASLFGIGVGMMAATRETVAISLLAWTTAGAIFLWRRAEMLGNERSGTAKQRIAEVVSMLWKPVILAAGICLVLIFFFYSEGLRRPAGFFDFFRTFFEYKTGEGHDKPFIFYLELLAWPKLIVARWWTEGAILVFALGVYLDRSKTEQAAIGRFFFESGVVHLLVFSFISYKTPWLPSLGWLHLCIAAGAGGFILIQRFSKWKYWVAVAVLIAVMLWHGAQAQRAAIRLAADGRNPYAYVPTSRDVAGLETWLMQMREVLPSTQQQPVAVIGEEYWPLPWYLRKLGEVGYWSSLPEGSNGMPLLLIMPTSFEEVSTQLKKTHTFIPRGLRDEFPIMVAIRNDLWSAYQKQ